MNGVVESRARREGRIEGSVRIEARDANSLDPVVRGEVATHVDVPAGIPDLHDTAYAAIESDSSRKAWINGSIVIETHDPNRLCTVVRGEVAAYIDVAASVRGDGNAQYCIVKGRRLVGRLVVGLVAIVTAHGRQSQCQHETRPK